MQLVRSFFFFFFCFSLVITTGVSAITIEPDTDFISGDTTVTVNVTTFKYDTDLIVLETDYIEFHNLSCTIGTGTIIKTLANYTANSIIDNDYSCTSDINTQNNRNTCQNSNEGINTFVMMLSTIILAMIAVIILLILPTVTQVQLDWKAIMISGGITILVVAILFAIGSQITDSICLNIGG